MKKLFASLIFSIVFLTQNFGQGIEFFHGTWAEALEKAKSENKIIFVDAYAAWCGPCKRMAATVFVDPKAGDFFNPNFINLKIDMEKPENEEFAGKYPVSAYPTLMFINAEGKIVVKDVGGKSLEQLLDFGKRALGTTDNSGKLEEKYASGDRDPQFLYEYIKALNQFGKPSLKIANEYLNSQKDLGTDFNLKFIHEAAVEADSRVFDLLIKNRAKIAGLVGEPAVKSRIELACKNTLKKAVEFRSADLHREAKSKLAANLPELSDEFNWTADSKFYPATKDADNYLKAVKTRQKKSVGKNAALLNDLVFEMVKAFPTDKKVLGQAEKWAKSAAETGGLPEYYLTLAEVYKRGGNLAKARTAAEKAKELASKNPTMQQKVDWFLMGLEEGSK